MENKSKLNTILLVIIIILLVVVLDYFFFRDSKVKEDVDLVNNSSQEENQIPATDNSSNNISVSENTYTYNKHGFTLELPKGYIPREEQAEGGPVILITLPNKNHLSYIMDMSFWEKYNMSELKFVKDEKIGETTFKVYTYNDVTIYYFKQGNVGIEYVGDKTLLSTFRFIGLAQN